MKPEQIEELASFLEEKFNNSEIWDGKNTKIVFRLALNEWFSPPKPVVTCFTASAMYDKGFGSECFDLPEFESKSQDEAKLTAENMAVSYLESKYKKFELQEIIIRMSRRRN